jgi:glycosyltransferase involved in cell wall biosynthesis
VICFDRINNREYLGEGGFFVKEISAQSLADKIIKAGKNPDALSEKQIIIKKKVKNFSWDISAEKIDKIYAQIKRVV